jgi:hypothetical protein
MAADRDVQPWSSVRISMKFGFGGGAGFQAAMHTDTSAMLIVNSNLFFIIIFLDISRFLYSRP